MPNVIELSFRAVITERREVIPIMVSNPIARVPAKIPDTRGTRALAVTLGAFQIVADNMKSSFSSPEAISFLVRRF